MQLYFFYIIDFFINTSLNFSYMLLPFNLTIWYIFKFIIVLIFLILLRAGLPRYRYDVLSLLGWSRFLFISLILLLLNYILIILWI